MNEKTVCSNIRPQRTFAIPTLTQINTISVSVIEGK